VGLSAETSMSCSLSYSGAQLIILRVAKGGHVDLMIR
jgi:hypothetical protein